MARKAIARSLLGLLLVAVAAWAGDPWKEKPYREWTAKEVQKVFGNSPWSRRVRILSGEVALGRVQPDIPNASAGGGSGAGSTGGSGSAVDASTASPAGGGPPAGSGGRIAFTVRWESALTVRQAKVRQQELQRGSVDEQEVERFLRAQPEQYEIVVFGTAMQAFEELGETAVRESAYLQPKKSKRKIPAERVEYIRQGPRLLAVRFFFPREIKGEPVIGSQEKRIKFYCNSSLSGISTNFDVRKMTRESGPDL